MKILHVFLFCALTCYSSWGQLSIKGLVIDEKGQPVIGATVFLNNTSYTTRTDSIGRFTLDGMNGDYQLIAYKEDYQLHFLEISRSVNLKITLKLSQRGKNWANSSSFSELEQEEMLNTFKRDFLGQSKNAEHCEILNPEVLKFELNTWESLIATATKPLLIRNKRLGYDMSYHLKFYERNSRISSYVGYVSFQNTPDLELKPRHFEAREKAYKGSTAHFLKAVLAGKHNREGYKLQTATQVGDGWLYKEVPVSDLAVYNDEGVFLFGAGKFRIIYLAERREYNFVRWLKASGIKEIGRGQYTEMEFASQKVKILPTGTIDPPLGLIFRGYMGWEKMGDALPMNYKP